MLWKSDFNWTILAALVYLNAVMSLFIVLGENLFVWHKWKLFLKSL
jgi:hypothetical protein